MDPLPANDPWPILAFLRDWIFIPGSVALTWVWNEVRLVKKEQRDQLDRIDMSVGRMADAFSAHALDDLRRFSSKDDLQILRSDVIALRQHIDERLDRIVDSIVKNGRHG